MALILSSLSANTILKEVSLRVTISLPCCSCIVNPRHTMKEACRQVDMGYAALMFCCNEGLVPGVKRDRRAASLTTATPPGSTG